jgi:hypothetical protein
MMGLLKAGFGLALAPTSLISLWLSAGLAAGLVSGSKAAAPFLAGACVALVLRVFIDLEESFAGRVLRSIYVLGHELTHAFVAWGSGGSVYDIKVGPEGGHVDLSKSSALISLAPYCFPIYAIGLSLGYRALQWWRPGLGGEAVFLGLLGWALGFHLLFTAEILWTRDQPDLKAAGGKIFSLSVIAFANGLGLLLWFKALFPRAIPLAESLRLGAALTRSFWVWAARVVAG